MKKYYDKLKYCLNILVLMSISIYFFEIFGSENGLTQCGIISFSSAGFYPSFFAMKKCKKIYKNYLADRSLQPQLMPTEPPAICASGEVELYKLRIIWIITFNTYCHIISYIRNSYTFTI